MNFFNKNKTAQSIQTTALKITLEHAGTLLYELNSFEYSREITIGRGTDCGWTLEGIDGSASTKHAVISKRKNCFYITDLGSRNGIYYQNKRVSERKLAPGDRISLGECTVCVEKFEESSRKAAQFHRLEYMDPKGGRITVDINKPRMLIGSSSGCDILLQNQLISSQHAELLLKSDGSCWIRDLNSRNGTSVNGMELAMDGERMLQDNDIITIAYLEIHFWDAAVEHQNAKIWPAVKTLAVTALILISAYIIWLIATPAAPELVKRAEVEMNNGNFETALKLLAAAEEARGPDKYRKVTEQMRRQIREWESVMALWAQVQQDIKERYYQNAIRHFGKIDLKKLNNWTWPKGAQARKEAEAAKRLLFSIASAKSTLETENASIRDVKLCREELQRAIAEAVPMTFLSRMIRDSAEWQEKLDKALNDDSELQAALTLLNSRQPDYQAVISRLQKLNDESSGPVKTRAAKVLPALQTLERENRRVLEMVDKVSEMDFKKVENFSPDLPDKIDWAIEKNIGSLKRSLIETVARFKEVATQLAKIHEGLVKKGVVIGREIPELKAFLDPEKMKGVYEFDCLNMPLPRNSRKIPAGKYDEMLGIEFFFDYINNIHTQTVTLNMDELPFLPRIYKAREIILGIEVFFRYAERDENQWFHRGRFAEYLAHCRKVLALRDRIVEEQLKYPAAFGTREFIVSRGLASYLLPDGIKQKNLCGEVERSYTVFKKNLLNLNREFNIAMPEEALKIRAKIIKTGLPGDSIVKKMWQQRPAAGWGVL